MSPSIKTSAPSGQRLKWWTSVLWPSFLAACILEALIFAWVDPAELGSPALADLSERGVYSLAFFVIWVVTAMGSGLTAWLHREGH